MSIFDVVKKLIAAGAGAALVFTASPSQAAVIDINDLTGWETIGNVSNNNNGGILLSTSAGDNDTEIESFLGLSSGDLDALNNIDATIGSAIKNSITVEAGDVLNFNWQFETFDYLPYNDFSFYSIGSSVNKLADVSQVGDFGQTASQTSYTFNTGGTYTVGFGVVNATDTAAQSNLTVGTSVPEPLTIFGTLTAAGFGVALRRKQQQQQKATAKA
ncbi:MAG: PEP-CTERM sorting domain-containing protein [Gloeotrichia echinulata DVL01]|jgi:hypothetical protein